MGSLIAGEAGAVLVAASRAAEPAAALGIEGLAGPVGRAYPARELPGPDGIDRVLLTECEASTEQEVRAWAASHGLVVSEHATTVGAPPDGIRVVAVSAAGTGAGKTPVVRKVARTLRMSGVEVCVIRHPIGSLLGWPDLAPVRVVRTPDDLGPARPLVESEEIAPVVTVGAPVVTGTDPDGMLAEAASLARVWIWDGGGAAAPWIRPDIHIVVLDGFAHPVPEAVRRVRTADAVIVTKTDTAPPDRVRAWEELVAEVNPEASLTLADMPIGVQDGMRIRRRDVAVVEDWSALALGGHRAGAGSVVARRWGCGVVDPRPFARGAVAEMLSAHPHIEGVVPSLGRTVEEMRDLSETLDAMPAEAIVWASAAPPVPVRERPVVRAYPEVMEVAGGGVQQIVQRLLPGYD